MQTPERHGARRRRKGGGGGGREWVEARGGGGGLGWGGGLWSGPSGTRAPVGADRATGSTPPRRRFAHVVPLPPTIAATTRRKEWRGRGGLAAPPARFRRSAKRLRGAVKLTARRAWSNLRVSTAHPVKFAGQRCLVTSAGRRGRRGRAVTRAGRRRWCSRARWTSARAPPTATASRCVCVCARACSRARACILRRRCARTRALVQRDGRQRGHKCRALAPRTRS